AASPQPPRAMAASAGIRQPASGVPQPVGKSQPVSAGSPGSALILLLPSVTSWKQRPEAPSRYSMAFTLPSGLPAAWSASAISPPHIGAEALVPPETE